ncbi:MAG: YceI family protein [Rickettsiales bacterium]
MIHEFGLLLKAPLMKLYLSLFAALAATTFSAQAKATDYVIDPKESSIKFAASQNGAPFNGEFSDVAGTIAFDSNAPQSAAADVRVQTSSVTADGDEIASTLLSAEWLGVKNFPEARFMLLKLTPAGDRTYIMQGELTVKGNVMPIDAKVTVAEQDAHLLVADTSFTFERLKFDVGWADVSSASANATVTAHIVAKARK